MKRYKIIISGGGYVGLLTALSLLNVGETCAIIEKQSIENLLKDDGRSFAISKITIDLLKKLNVWSEVENHVEFIKSVYCFEENQIPTIHLSDSKLLCGMLSSFILKNVLFNKLKPFSNFEFIENYLWSDIEFNDASNECYIFSERDGSKECDFISEMIIATEGRHSKMISYFNLKQFHHDYHQEATIFNIEHEVEHNHTAIEKFFPEGAIALLPLKSEENNHSAVVWINKTAFTNHINNLDEEKFCELFNSKINYMVGNLKIRNFQEKKVYPLKLSFLQKYSHRNIVFLGDISHAIHPIAGQGLNLIIQDLNKLIEIIENNSNDFDFSKIGKTFMRKRIFPNLAMIGFTHLLVKMFEGNNSVLKYIRNRGIDFLEKSKILKKIF